VARVCLVACALFVAACEPAAGRELIPAEWTIAEDTSASGEVTTASLQLPAARDIDGLLEEEAPRLILRCLEGRVQAFIATESSPAEGGAPVPDSQMVQVQLDSAPVCE
jgi:hypothetical protein